MITTRERITVSELVKGVISTATTSLDSLLEEFVPLRGRQIVYASQGKAAFEQIVLAAGLERSRILMPAFFPDDFVGIFLKYDITPVFVDVHPHTYHLDLGTLTRRHLEGAKALLLEHTFGLPADGARYRSFCDEHGLVMIEDCARALGASSRGNLVGSFGHHAMFSLPKCAPVRAGGLAVSERPFRPRLEKGKIGLSGLLHSATLIRYPFSSAIEGTLYQLLADSPIYPREVGNYNPLPMREFDAVSKFMLKAFMPLYRDALSKKRACAHALRAALEPRGFTFQADQGEHIYTSLAAESPSSCDADRLKTFLNAHGVKASSMWRNAIGVSEFGRKTWKARPEDTPVALRLSERLIQLPVSRFRTHSQSRQVVELCERFVSDASPSREARPRLASSES